MLVQPALKHQHRDVVGATGLVGRFHQLVGSIVQVDPHLEQVAESRRLDHTRQSIRAEQKDVAVLNLGGRDVDLYRVLHAERAGDHVAVRKLLLLVLRHARPGLLVVLKQRVVPRELLGDTIADSIAT